MRREENEWTESSARPRQIHAWFSIQLNIQMDFNRSCQQTAIRSLDRLTQSSGLLKTLFLASGTQSQHDFIARWKFLLVQMCCNVLHSSCVTSFTNYARLFWWWTESSSNRWSEIEKFQRVRWRWFLKLGFLDEIVVSFSMKFVSNSFLRCFTFNGVEKSEKNEKKKKKHEFFLKKIVKMTKKSRKFSSIFSSKKKCIEITANTNKNPKWKRKLGQRP